MRHYWHRTARNLIVRKSVTNKYGRLKPTPVLRALLKMWWSHKGRHGRLPRKP